MDEVCLYMVRKSKDDRQRSWFCPSPAGPPMMLELGCVMLVPSHDGGVETYLQVKGVLEIEFF